MSRLIALATCAAFPDLEEPERLVIQPLADLGLTAVPVVWDDPGVEWSSFDLVVNRGTWDYAERAEEFLDWIDHAAAVTSMVNPAEVVRWNIDKRYLQLLSTRGIPIVPTTFWGPGEQPALPADGEYVVKPTTSAGSRDTARYLAGAEDVTAQAHVTRLLADGRDLMVQPYIDSVDEHGETALLYLGGAFSHAIRKGPLLAAGAAPTNELFAEETVETRVPSPAEHEVAAAVMEELTRRFGRLTFARVDLLAGPDGPLVLEVELIEPSLFIQTDDRAPDRLAQAIRANL